MANRVVATSKERHVIMVGRDNKQPLIIGAGIPGPPGADGSGGGSISTSNTGSGVGLAKPRSGNNLPFRSLSAGDSVSIETSPDGNEVEIGLTWAGSEW